jgi:hypothetical protein
MRYGVLAVGVVMAWMATAAAQQAPPLPCPENLAATTQWGNLLNAQQDALQREVAILRAKLAAAELARAVLQEKGELEKKLAPAKPAEAPKPEPKSEVPSQP